jgi:hypothetical protein
LVAFFVVFFSGRMLQTFIMKKGRLSQLFSDVSNDPATFIALGSVFMAAAQGGIEGAVANAVAAVGIGGLAAYESLTGQKKGRPFLGLAALNVFTAGSIGYHAHQNDALGEINQQTLFTLMYLFSGVRSSLLAWHEWRGTKAKNFTNDPQFYQGIGALLTTRLEKLPQMVKSMDANAIPIVLALAGIARTFVHDEPGEKQGFFRRHFTAARAYTAQYGISSLLAQDWRQTVAFGLWAWGFSRFDRDLNDELKNGPGNYLLRKGGWEGYAEDSNMVSEMVNWPVMLEHGDHVEKSSQMPLRSM